MSHNILRLPAVISKTGIARSTIYAKIAEREFPQPIRLGSRSVGWLETEIDQWLSQRIAASGRIGDSAMTNKQAGVNKIEMSRIPMRILLKLHANGYAHTCISRNKETKRLPVDYNGFPRPERG